jgi:hypothetical protein
MKIYEFYEYHGEHSAYVTADTLEDAIKVYMKEHDDYVDLEDTHVEEIYELKLPNNKVVGSMDWTEPEGSPFGGKRVWQRGVEK